MRYYFRYGKAPLTPNSPNRSRKHYLRSASGTCCYGNHHVCVKSEYSEAGSSVRVCSQVTPLTSLQHVQARFARACARTGCAARLLFKSRCCAARIIRVDPHFFFHQLTHSNTYQHCLQLVLCGAHLTPLMNNLHEYFLCACFHATERFKRRMVFGDRV